MPETAIALVGAHDALCGVGSQSHDCSFRIALPFGAKGAKSEVLPLGLLLAARVA